jgi:hypothetical protein
MQDSAPTKSNRRFGAGGIGQVYKARDSDRIVAIKTANESSANASRKKSAPSPR